MLTLKEFVKLSENERKARYHELSAKDRAFVRLHEAQGASIPPGEESTAEDTLASIEEDEKLLGIDFSELKENLKKQ